MMSAEKLAYKKYQTIDEESGEVYSKILYNEGYPLQIRANMKYGVFCIEDDHRNGLEELTIIPIAIRKFKGQMFLKKEDIEKIQTDKTGEEYEKSVKDWIEIYFVNEEGLVCCMLLKTWGASAVEKALNKPEVIKDPLPRLVRPLFDRKITLGVEMAKENGNEFGKPFVKEVEHVTKEEREMLQQFAKDYKLYSIENAAQHVRFQDSYLLTKHEGWFNPFQNEQTMVETKDVATALLEAENNIETAEASPELATTAVEQDF